MRLLLALLLLLLAAPAYAICFRTAATPRPEARTNLGVRIFSPVKDHAADPTGATDASAAIQASQVDCAAAGGGVIDITGARLKTGNITIAAGCPIEGTRVPGRCG